MKNSSLHKTLAALDLPTQQTLQHQQVLKGALLRYQAPQQTLFTRFRAAAKTIVGVPMTHKKLFASVGSLAVIAILALSITTYNYGHSPRAEAEQLVSQGIGFVHTIGNAQMSKLQTQLGDDPIKALEEAKAAKDLQVISKDEFTAESAKHKGVAMSSLGKDGPQYGSIGISANGESLPTTPPNGAQTHYSTGGQKEAGTVRIDNDTASGTSSAGSPAEKTLELHVNAGSGEGVDQSGPVNFTPPTPSKYLRYTDSTGHVVVLGLNDQGVPINKTVFMTDAEVGAMQKGGQPLNIKH